MSPGESAAARAGRPARQPVRHRVDGRRTERHPADLRSLADHGHEAAVEVAVGDAQPAALGDPQTRPVEDLEDGEVAEHHRGRDRVVGIGVVLVVAGVLGGVEQVGGLVGTDHPGQSVGALRGTQAPARVVLDHAVALQVAQVGAEGRRLAGDGGTGETPGVEVGEVAAQGAAVEGGGTGAATPFGPRHEFGDVVRVGVARVRAEGDERRHEVVRSPSGLV